MPTITQYVIKVPEAVIDRRDWVRYLALVNWHFKEVGDSIIATPSKDFNAFVEKTLNEYLSEKKMPDPEIAPVVMNLADDHFAGRELFLRAGDYYILQNHFRKVKGKTKTKTRAK
ncbi:hypothetical protein J2128_002150 [Methanomicrobium sp. W14]|uniref:hypothetical protein n=1 Tax=Methanomicrobium sp. W14 TaxID=2817839 RepID=UPI001AE8386D|nr:hypothetical protein [Methanomicrobium sp. W14]MBP2134184.1 hypothetical protein [Methanomicrobium sp. W14]